MQASMQTLMENMKIDGRPLFDAAAINRVCLLDELLLKAEQSEAYKKAQEAMQ